MRGGTTADVVGLAGLRAKWRGYELTPEFLDQFEGWFIGEQSSRWWWLAEADSEPIGMLNLKVFDRMPSPAAPTSRWGYLGNLFVVPSHRGRGIGGQLIDALLARAAGERLVRIVLSPTGQSVPLYARHGFVMADELLVCRL